MPPVFQPRSRKRFVIGAGIVVGVLLVLPFLLPLGYYIPRIERMASEELSDKVRISSLRLFILPYPHLAIGGIEVGAKPYLQIRKVTVAPRLLSLLDEQKIIREISLRNVVIGAQLVGKASAWGAQRNSGGPQSVRVERIVVRGADINLHEFRLRQVDLDLELNEAGNLSRAQLRADKGAVQATMVPRKRDFALDLHARDWKLPAGPPLVLSSLAAKGSIGPEGLDLSSISGRFYGGTLTGKLSIAWKEGWKLAGLLDMQQVDIKPLVAVFSREATLSGRLSATPVIDMQAATASQLGEAIHVEAPFKVEEGVIYDFDLAAAPRALLDKNALKGGQTKFNEFTGYLIVDPSGYHLIDLKIASGVLKAEGEVSISPDLKLNGLIDASVKGTSALVSTPLAVAGTVQDPFLYPSKAAIAGAAAGTALLGPGLGTTVGMKAMRLTGRIFGKKKRAFRPQAAAAPAKATASPASDEDKGAAGPLAEPGVQPAGPSTGKAGTTRIETSGRR
jgi:uncharacterized protein involved in outer membrane biogenesis